MPARGLARRAAHMQSLRLLFGAQGFEIRELPKSGSVVVHTQQNANCTKGTDHMVLEETLVLPFISTPGVPLVLDAIFMHKGKTVRSGHWYFYKNLPVCGWYKFNDSVVTP